MNTEILSMGHEMTIVQAAALRESLLARLATAPRELALDLGEVADFDSAGVQLLLATQRSLSEAGARLCITAVSPTVRRNLELFGLQALLETPTPEVG